VVPIATREKSSAPVVVAIAKRIGDWPVVQSDDVEIERRGLASAPFIAPLRPPTTENFAYGEEVPIPRLPKLVMVR
jgi:hypothetical protein